MSEPSWACITITTVYDDARRNIVAVQYECQDCGEVWEHEPLAAALAASTSSPFDRQCAKHRRTCPGRPT